LTAFCAKAVVALSPSGQILHRYPSNQDGYDWVAVDGKGNIDVPNSRDGTLEQFAPDAPHPSILHRFDANDPWGVAVDRDGNIYVALSGTDVIVKLSPTGAELSRSAPLEGGPQKTEVDAIVVDSHGTVYAAIGASRSQLDTEIIKLSPDWQDLGVVASSGTGPGQVQGVGGMAVDAQDNLYVVDGGNNRIEKFSPSDQLLATWPHT
jgi:sugar lactone lactonase YvrE